MKMIIAIIRPEKLQPVKDALKETGHSAMTITDVRGRGKEGGLTFTNRIGSFVVDEIEKIKIEMVVEDDETQNIIDTVVNTAATGRMGDGRIFVLPVEQSIRIRSSD